MVRDNASDGESVEPVDMQKSMDELARLIKDIQICMMTTVDADGTLHSRPMACQNEKFDGVMWFFTDEESPKTDEIRSDRHVNLSFVGSDQTYISLSGRAMIVHDKTKAEELWTPAHRAWFPEGVEDPKLALLRIEIDKAEYWTAPPSAVVRVLGFAKALVTGKRYDGGKDRKLDLKAGEAEEIKRE